MAGPACAVAERRESVRAAARCPFWLQSPAWSHVPASGPTQADLTPAFVPGSLQSQWLWAVILPVVLMVSLGAGIWTWCRRRKAKAGRGRCRGGAVAGGDPGRGGSAGRQDSDGLRSTRGGSCAGVQGAGPRACAERKGAGRGARGKSRGASGPRAVAADPTLLSPRCAQARPRPRQLLPRPSSQRSPPACRVARPTAASLLPTQRSPGGDTPRWV